MNRMSDEKPEENTMTPADADAIESRQADRLKPAANCRVTDVLTNTTLGEVLNISSEGLMLAAPVPISEGSIYQVDIRCQLQDMGHIFAGIECLWTDPHGNGGTLAGFQIIDISDEDRQALYRLLEASSY